MSKYKTHKSSPEGKMQTTNYKKARRAKRILAQIEERALIARLGH